MKFIIKPKYQYFLLILYYPLIGIISAINFARVKNNKHAIIILLLLFGIWLVVDEIIPIVINDNFNIDLYNSVLMPGLIYGLLRNVIIGFLFIRDQKKNIDFDKLLGKQ